MQLRVYARHGAYLLRNEQILINAPLYFLMHITQGHNATLYVYDVTCFESYNRIYYVSNCENVDASLQMSIFHMRETRMSIASKHLFCLSSSMEAAANLIMSNIVRRISVKIKRRSILPNL